MEFWKRFATTASFWSDRNVLITGCNGFLGSRMVELLKGLRANVTGIDRDPYKTGGVPERFYQIDVCDRDGLERVFAERKPEVIFHLAAVTQVVDARSMPFETFRTNILGTAAILDVNMRFGGDTTAIVVASSDKAYGRVDAVADEHTALNPYHPYDVSKASADYIARCYAEQYGQKVSVTRCGNIYGPGDRNWQRIVPGTLRALLKEERLLIRSDGTPKREYIYIDDVVYAYMLVAENLLADGPTGVSWPIAADNGYMSVLEVAQSIAEVVDKPLDYFCQDIAKSEEHSLRLDSALIRHELQWEPSVSWEDGIRMTDGWATTVLGTKSPIYVD